jgi:hypothetical protein
VKRAAQTLAFVAQHGVVLASARGAAPRLIDAIAGEVIAGNWWSYPQANTIYNVLTEVQASEDILVCRLLGGKITLVHRRLWPALVRAADTFAPQRIARVREEHTASGRHVVQETPFPQWVPVDVLQQSQALSEEQALRALGLGAG